MKTGSPSGLDGLRFIPGFLDSAAQADLCASVSALLTDAPLYRPTMPRSGKPFSVHMTNCGELGWISDSAGYRYEARHPRTGRAWPPIPASLLAAWSALSDYPHPPEACLINVYHPGARLGMHQDKDEEDFRAPVVSLSLGDTARFRVGGLKRRDPSRSVRLRSGDAVVLGGAARLAFHGIDTVYPGTSSLLTALLPDGGRINLTLRRVTRPA